MGGNALQPAALSGGAEALAMDPVAQVPLPNLREYERQGHHQKSSWRQSLWPHRGPHGRGLSNPRVHGSVPRNVAQFRIADDGEIWNLLLFQIRKRGGRLAQSALPGPRR